MTHLKSLNLPTLISLLLLVVSGVVLVGLHIKAAGWVILYASVMSLTLADRKFSKNLFLTIISLGPIATNTSYGHFVIFLI